MSNRYCYRKVEGYLVLVSRVSFLSYANNCVHRETSSPAFQDPGCDEATGFSDKVES